MTFKKILSLLLAVALLAGIVLPCISVTPARAVPQDEVTESTPESTPTLKLYDIGGTKYEQVTDPEMGKGVRCYLAADLDGTLRYFSKRAVDGAVGDTSPYSLPTNADFSTSSGYGVYFDLDGADGFKMYYGSTSSRTYIYCLATGTGTHGDNNSANHAVFFDEASGVPVIRKRGGAGDTYVLVMKQMENNSQSKRLDWRILFVPEADLSNDGVYPVMLLKEHVHNYVYQYDGEQHWKACACGEVEQGSEKTAHAFTKQSHDDASHFMECECGMKSGVVPHVYGEWDVDADTHTQTRSCTCGYVQTYYGETPKMVVAETPVMGKEPQYYLAANVEGTLRYFRYASGIATQTLPYSLVVTEDYQSATKVRFQKDQEDTDGNGLQIRFLRPGGGQDLYIYCYKTSSGNIDTGIGGADTDGFAKSANNTFVITNEGDMSVLRKKGGTGDGYVLAVEQMENVKSDNTLEWRMVCVPAADLSKAGVYPVMPMTEHVHSNTYAYDENQHWQVCDCGETGEKAAHNYGPWTVNADQHTQTRTCTDCGREQVYYDAGNGTMLFSTRTPKTDASTRYYLAAELDGTLRYFSKRTVDGAVTDTSPYSLPTNVDFSTSKGYGVYLEQDGIDGFKMYYSSNKYYVYCIPAGTGTHGDSDSERHTVFFDEANGIPVIRKRGGSGDGYVLVMKQLANNNQNKRMDWRMQFVPEAELSNPGVYPVMLLAEHTHDYQYDHDDRQHWQECSDCGYTTPHQNHEFHTDGETGDSVCDTCGYTVTQHEHRSESGYQSDANGHWQICDICNARFNESEHSYGDWVVDKENHTQTKTCDTCQWESSLYGDGDKFSWVEDPEIGSDADTPLSTPYYLVARDGDGVLHYFYWASGIAGQTTPYTLVTTEDYLGATPVGVWEDAAANGIQIVFTNPSNGNNLFIYCYNANGGGDVDTGNGSMVAGETGSNRYTFVIDNEGDLPVLRKKGGEGDGYILVIKQFTVGDKEVWRLVGVNAKYKDGQFVEETKDGDVVVYPVMLAEHHEHNFGSEYESDDAGHWKVCTDCGYATEHAQHELVKQGDDYVCEVCDHVLKNHTHSSTGSLHFDETGHWKVCDLCGSAFDKVEHTLGAWEFHDDHTQTKTCDACGWVYTLYGDEDKFSWVEDPVFSSTTDTPLSTPYYLVARDGDGVLHYFYWASGIASQTTPFTLVTTEEYLGATPVGVWEDAAANGIQIVLVNPSNGNTLPIYCYNANGGGDVDTGNGGTVNDGTTSNRHTFVIDNEGDLPVLRKKGGEGDGYILVIKQFTVGGKEVWRLVGVKATYKDGQFVEETKDGDVVVYPVMLAVHHEHNFGTEYESNDSGHWQVCADCDYVTEHVKHELVKQGNDYVCEVCGHVLKNHTHSSTGSLHYDDTYHWKVCDVCSSEFDKAEHKMGAWKSNNDHTQSATCETCGYVLTYYGEGDKVSRVDTPTMGSEYYLSAMDSDGVVHYFTYGTVSTTSPYSLVTTEIAGDATPLTLDAGVGGSEGFQMYFPDPKDGTGEKLLYLYCYETASGSGVVNTGNNGGPERSKHSFVIRVENGTQLIIKDTGAGDGYVLVVKKMKNTAGETVWRMLGVPAEELGKEDVYPVMLSVTHHNFSDKWSYDASHHWHECSCGAIADEGAHEVAQWKIEREATTDSAGRRSGVCSVCGQTIVQAIPMNRDKVTPPANGGKYYLTGVVNGVRYYFCHTPSGTSVTDTTPYALYTLVTGKAPQIKVSMVDGNYVLGYGTNGLCLYMNSNGMGATSKSDANMVQFLWDAENKLLYQMENGEKYVMVFRFMKNNKTGGQEVRITGMPMDEALLDPTVGLATFTTVAPPAGNTSAEATFPTAPEEATPLKTYTPPEPDPEIGHEDDALAPRDILSEEPETPPEEGKGSNVLLTVLLCCIVVLLALILLALLRNTKFGRWFLGKWNVWTALLFVVAAVVLVAGMLNQAEEPAAAPEVDETPSLADFTIVTNAANMSAARKLAVTLYEDYGMSLPVVQSKDYTGNMGIYLDTQGVNSYGGYKYSVYAQEDEYGPGVYINGSGPSLNTAIDKWLSSIKDPTVFPFGLEETISDYEWNSSDADMTGLGFSLEASESQQLTEGVELRKLTYNSFAFGKVTGYAVIVESDANVELKVAAGDWDENTTVENPATRFTVEEYGDILTKEGYDVLSITNAGFFNYDNGAGSFLPHGAQIVDGYVRKTPSKENPRNTDNFFGQTADGKYVISDTDGYYETYESTLAQAVGGGLVLMKDGKPCFTSAPADYRTVVGLTKDGDLIILSIYNANYAFVTQVYMDLDMDVVDILNLDGGGSTTLHSLGENGPLTRLLCENANERTVADAIAIVKKK